MTVRVDHVSSVGSGHLDGVECTINHFDVGLFYTFGKFFRDDALLYFDNFKGMIHFGVTHRIRCVNHGSSSGSRRKVRTEVFRCFVNGTGATSHHD